MALPVETPKISPTGKYSIRQAMMILEKRCTQTIYNYCRDGKLRYGTRADDTMYIKGSELIRFLNK